MMPVLTLIMSRGKLRNDSATHTGKVRMSGCSEQFRDRLTFGQHGYRTAGVVEETLTRVNAQDFVNRGE